MKINFSAIKSKLLIITFSIAFFMFWLGLFSFYYLNRLEKLSQLTIPINSFIEDLNNLQKAEIQFLLNERQNINFFTGSYSEQYELFNQYYKINENRINSIIEDENYSMINDTSLDKSLNSVNQNLNLYKTQFQKLVKTTRERGMSKYGLIGQLNKQEAFLFEQIKPMNDEHVLHIFSSLKEMKTDCILKNNIKLRSEIISKNYKQQLLSDTTGIFINSQMPHAYRRDLIDNFDLYFQLITKLINKDIEIDLIIDAGQAYKNNVNTDILKSLKLIKDESQYEAKTAKIKLSILVLLLLIIIFIAMNLFVKSIISPISIIKSYILKLAKGKFPKRINLKNKDEIAEMAQSLNIFIDSLKEKATFASKIGNGNYDISFKELSKADKLGISLLEMRSSLQGAQNKDITRKLEEKKRNWATQGIAQFADILRKDNSDIKQLSHNIIKKLVNYLDANQGALFVINDNNPSDVFMELVSAFAYDKKKKLHKRIELDEGLIGRCVVENSIIYMTDIPDTYLEITSGLGNNNPKALLIVPLTLNDEIFGVVEIASFNEFESYQREFVAKVGESIASTLSIVKVNTTTTELLEQSQQQAEELAAQEEEMRQNIEELQVTQEGAARREAEMNSLLDSINNSTYAVEYDLYGKILKVNSKVEITLKTNAEVLIDTYHKDYVDFAEITIEEYEQFWNDLRSGITKHQISKKHVGKVTVWLQETYSPIFNENMEVEKVLNIALDITEQKKLQNELKNEKDQMQEQEAIMKENLDKMLSAQDEHTINMKDLENERNKLSSVLEAINTYILRIDYDVNGVILDVNRIFEERSGFSKDEVIGKNATIFVKEEDKEQTKIMWKNLANGKYYKGIANRTFKKLEYKLAYSYTPVKNTKGEIDRIIYLGTDISDN